MKASEELLDLACMAIYHGFDSIEAGCPFVPFLVVEGAAGEWRLERFVSERVEDGPAKAREHLHALRDVRRAALAYDGYVTIDGHRCDAILVEADEVGRGSSLLLAQRYRPGNRLRRVAPIGNVRVLGDDEPLL